ncbi:MAG: hypothetical protein CSA22_08385 [Deltaproteobacteria bacterium]|nr:MAG: hypothetical protein CSA22_08385 [Deltaproteobacteria bacterium]
MNISQVTGNYKHQGYITDTAEQPQPAGQATAGASAKASRPPADRVSLSSNSKDMQLINTAIQSSPEVTRVQQPASAEKVSALKQQIAARQYTVNANAVATRILNDIA